jgi:hypothetical protein
LPRRSVGKQIEINTGFIAASAGTVVFELERAGGVRSI